MFYREALVRAAKKHQCTVCPYVIAQGEVHYRFVSRVDDFHYGRICLPCEFTIRLVKAEGDAFLEISELFTSSRVSLFHKRLREQTPEEIVNYGVTHNDSNVRSFAVLLNRFLTKYSSKEKV